MAMRGKRKLVHYEDDDDDNHGDANAIKRPFSGPEAKRARNCLKSDSISALSDEILIRVFSFLDEKTLLAISPVCHRFNRITSDSQLWRPHYYLRFILPRAHRIPGFRTGSTRSSSKLRYAAGKTIWADGGWGRRGGFVGASAETSVAESAVTHQRQEAVDWKKQYRLRHNWARGRCAVDEVQVRQVEHDASVPATEWQTLVKVVDGLAVTVDGASGLRTWDLKTRRLVAQTALSVGSERTPRQPTCLAVDEVLLAGRRVLDVAVGFEDGTFEIHRLDVKGAKTCVSYRHNKGYFGALAAISYAHPYLLTASRPGFISLYSFDTADVAAKNDADSEARSPQRGPDSPSAPASSGDDKKKKRDMATTVLRPPRLLTSLKSHSTRMPLALSIRRTKASAVASVAYTFDAISGWCIGIQDLDIRPGGTKEPDAVVSRVAYTLPVQTRRSAPPSLSTPSRPAPARPRADERDGGPVRLCYSHPYLLATLPDNTLVLHLCTSTASSLSISPGIRLWGHTSGISDAEITPRGKAVSVSTRGDEIRVWELEGRVGGSSVELRPRVSSPGKSRGVSAGDGKNWVGFDDEMVVVLQGGRDGRESLLVYDFT